MHTSPLRTRAATLVVLAAALALAAPPVVATAAPDAVGQGSITGTVRTPPAGRADVFAPTAYVARLDRPGSIIALPVSARGRFRATVAPGLYSVVSSGYARKAPKDRLTLVAVRAGRTVKARTQPHRRAGDVKVSIGGFTPPAGADADSTYFARGLPDLMINDLLAAVDGAGGCQRKVRIFEDRKYGRFDETLKELRLRTTRLFSEQDRASARAALRKLPTYTPTLRVTGSVTSLSPASATGRFRVVHIPSGRTVFSTDVASASAFDLSVDGSAAVARFLCRVEVATVPQTLSGTFSGSVATGSQSLTWNGTTTKTFVATDPVTGFTYLDSAHYRTTSAAITWQVTGRCSGSGTLALADLSTDFYDSTVDWAETAGKGWAYGLGLSPRSPMLVPCPPDADGHPTPPYDASNLVGRGGGGGALMYSTDTRGPESNRFSPDNVAFRGVLSINPGFAQSWTWDLVGAGEVPVPDGV